MGTLIDGRPVALVTGATRGFGRALVERLKEDYTLLVGGRGPSAAVLAAELPSARAFVCDLADVSSIARATAEVGRVDLLVHSAGIAPVGRPDELQPDVFDMIMKVNVVAVAELTRALLPLLRESRGTVVMINSGAGLRGSAAMAGYAASKFALTGYTQSLRLAEPALRVISVHPGQMSTDMQQEMHQAWGKPYVASDHMSAESVATLVAHAISMPRDMVAEVLEIRPPA